MSRIGLFSDFNEEQLRLLAFGSQKLHFPKKTHVFHDGQSTDGGFVILSGNLNLVREIDGKEQIIGRFKAGDLIGEMAILTRNKRIGSALVIEDCELMKISRSTMHRVLSEYPELAAVLHKRIVESVTAFTQKLDRIERSMQRHG